MDQGTGVLEIVCLHLICSKQQCLRSMGRKPVVMRLELVMPGSFLISHQLPTVLQPVQIRFSCSSLQSISSFVGISA
jgi:hypothetical protein